jgi:hypothetical protein
MGDAEGFIKSLSLSRPIGVPKHDVAMSSTFAVEVVIEDAPNPQFQAAVPLLAYLTSYTTSIIKLFEPAFADAPPSHEAPPTSPVKG